MPKKFTNNLFRTKYLLTRNLFVDKLCSLKRKVSVVGKISLREKLSIQSTLNKLNAHYAEINNRYEPIQETLLTTTNSDECLYVSEISVLKAFEKLNARKSNVPGALPARFLKFAAVHIVPMYTHIINYSYKNSCVPTEWKKGFITPVPKDTSNIELETIRPIKQTNIYSKIMEEFMFRRIYDQVISKLNDSQFGAIKKSSTAYCPC